MNLLMTDDNKEEIGRTRRKVRNRYIAVALLSVVVILLIIAVATGYITDYPDQVRKLSVGDTVYVKLSPQLTGEGIVRTYDRTTSMITVQMRNSSGRDVMLNIHYAWLDHIVIDVPEVINDTVALKILVSSLTVENNKLRDTITVHLNTIDKMKGDMQAIEAISSRYK